MVRIFVADDHSLIREGIRKILAAASDMTIVGEAGDSHSILDGLTTLTPDILLLDISLADKSGIDLLADIQPQFPSVKVLMLTMYPERLFAIRSLRAGAKGYLTKESAAEELITAIRQVAHGGHYITPAIADQMADLLADPDKRAASIEALSDREIEVLRMIGSGKKVSDIAKDLSITVSTVHTYRRRLLEKLHLRSTSDLIRFALEKGLTR